MLQNLLHLLLCHGCPLLGAATRMHMSVQGFGRSMRSAHWVGAGHSPPGTQACTWRPALLSSCAGRRGKLCLVLDLDHTLLNSARFSEVDPALAQRLEQRCASEAEALPEADRLLFRMDDIKVFC